MGRRHERTGRWIAPALIVVALVLMVVLRVAALDSDPYSRLSWSSGLLTDEGYYIHNARNVVLFGVARTDEFNNMLIMPTLHFVQVAVFRQWGAGAVPARMISVVCSLVGIAVLFAAARRAFGLRIAVYAALFLGLDHVNLLYNRMALMDTPAAMLLICAFYAWVRGMPDGDPGRTRGWWLAACGAALGLAFVTRGLAVFVLPVPFAAAWLAGRRKWNLCLSVALGLCGVLLPYLALWYVPHRAELAHVNSYYLWRQLLPHDGQKLGLNFANAWFGDERGAGPFLMRHSPVVFLLVLGRLVYLWQQRHSTPLRPLGDDDPAGMRGPHGIFVTWWLVFAALFLSVANYTPSRYYLLFYPAVALTAAFALANARGAARAVRENRPMQFLLGAYGAYHLALLVWHHGSAASIALVGAAALLGGGAALGLVRTLQMSPEWSGAVRQSAAGLLLFGWAGINGYYTLDWLMHLSYEQRDASRWLAANLPPNTVLIGDAAPGVCLYNTFEAITVIPGLCNDRQPVEQFRGRTIALVILDDPYKERWWTEKYPILSARESRIKLFPHIGRFPVGVFALPAQRTAGGPQ